MTHRGVARQRLDWAGHHYPYDESGEKRRTATRGAPYPLTGSPELRIATIINPERSRLSAAPHAMRERMPILRYLL